MDRHNRIFVFLLILAVVTVACAPLLPAVAQLPTQPAGALGTYVAGTRIAAASGTAQNTTPSRTPTITFTPSKTPTITPTGTATIIFKFKTFTPFPTATQGSSGGGGGGGGGGSSGGGGDDDKTGDLVCRVTSTIIKVGGVIVTGDPPIVPANTNFTVTWSVRNKGNESWNHNEVDYQYLSGTLFELEDPHHSYTYDFPDTPAVVKPGMTVDLVIDHPSMISPNKKGTYNDTWTLLVSNNIKFCKMVFVIIVP